MAKDVSVAVSPDTHIRIEGCGAIPYQTASERPRIVEVEGQRCEHVSTDPDGVWVYRPMR